VERNHSHLSHPRVASRGQAIRAAARFDKIIKEDFPSGRGKLPMVFRLGKCIHGPSMVLVLLLVAVPRSSVILETPQENTLREVQRLVWLNNWTEAAQVLDRLGFAGRRPADESSAIFFKAVHIRGNIESMALPSAAGEIGSMLASVAGKEDFNLQIQLLAIKGDIEFQYSLPAAQKTWEEAKQLASNRGRFVWEARAEGELGTIAFLNGEIFSATRLVTGAILRAELSGDVAAQIRYRTALGEGFAEYGRPADATRFFDKALALSASTPGAYFPFTAYLGKARLLTTSGRSVEGLRMLHDGLDQARRRNLKVREARILVVLGELAASAGKHDEAVTSLTSAADVAHSAGLDRIEADASSALASLLRSLGKTETAGVYARRSVAAAQRAGDLYHLPQLTAVLAEIEETNGNLLQADADYSRATDLVDGLLKGFPHPRNKNILVATMGRVYEGHFDLALNRSKDLSKAFQILELARAYGLVDVLRDRGAVRHHLPVLDSTLAPQIAAVNRNLSNEQDSGQRKRLLDRLWELEVRALHPSELSKSSQAQPVSLQQLQASLPEGDLVIEYAVQPMGSFAIAISRDRTAQYALKSHNELEAAVELHLAAIRSRRDARPEGKALYQLLLQPVTLLAQSKRVVIIPDGKLHLVAFDALVDPNDRYAVETHVISYAPSATVYYLLSRPTAQQAPQVALLAVGGAHYTISRRGDVGSVLRGLGFFDPSGPPRWPPLPQTLAEVTDIATSQFGKALVLTGDNATEAAVKRLPLSTFRVLHFALHSTVDEEFPDRSALVLSSNKDDVEDDLLQAREVVALNLNAELVTLSACDVGAGKIEGVAGMNSLVQAFLMAGARSVVATIWAADDMFTAALMRRFYANLRRGFDKAEALTQAKRELLQTNGPNALPFYWAGFRLVGDPHGTISGE
jgi:CHAT domain-containing protein